MIKHRRGRVFTLVVGLLSSVILAAAGTAVAVGFGSSAPTQTKETGTLVQIPFHTAPLTAARAAKLGLRVVELPDGRRQVRTRAGRVVATSPNSKRPAKATRTVANVQYGNCGSAWLFITGTWGGFINGRIGYNLGLGYSNWSSYAVAWSYTWAMAGNSGQVDAGSGGWAFPGVSTQAGFSAAVGPTAGRFRRVPTPPPARSASSRRWPITARRCRCSTCG